MDDFINRKTDLKNLDALWQKKGAQFVVAYGRRRVGKTALLSYFAQTKKMIHWLAYRSTAPELLKDLSQAIHKAVYPDQVVSPEFSYGNWQALFETLAVHGKTKRIGLVIDEFPYLVESDSSFPTLLQAVWDKLLSKTQIFLVLSGSSLAMMKDHVLTAKAPLYGRATALLPVEPIGFSHLKEFFPRYSPVQLVEVFGVTGGIPKYFEFFSGNTPVLKSLETLVHNRTSLLTSEPEFLLHEEFRETRIYLAILRCLGLASKDLSGIAAYTGLGAKNLSKYLDDLIQIKLIKRHTPATVDASKSRKGFYKICDHFLAFYFRFISPFHSEWEKNQTDNLIDNLKKNFDAFIGQQIFENLCQEYIQNLSTKNKLSFTPTRIGSYWNKEMQIDVMGINHHDQVALVGECKWTNQPLTASVITELEEKIKKLRGDWDYTYQLYFFSRAGFTAEAIKLAQKKQYHCVELNEIFV